MVTNTNGGCGDNNDCPSDDDVNNQGGITSSACSTATYTENRVIRQVQPCAPKVIETPGGTVEISGEPCSLLDSNSGALRVLFSAIPSDDNAVTWTGCGSTASPIKPKLNYAVIEAALDDGDTTVYVTTPAGDTTLHGWKYVNGKLAQTGKFIADIVSSDSTISVTYNPATFKYDLKIPAAPPPSEITDAPAEFGLIGATSVSILGTKVVTVSISNVPNGSGGTVSVTPNHGVIPPSQSYTAAGGSSSLSFNIDTAATSIDVICNNSLRQLIQKQSLTEFTQAI